MRGRPAAEDTTELDPEKPEVANAEALSLEVDRRMRSRVAGIFLFLPLLGRLRFDRLVGRADYPGSKMVPATSALLSLLALKLWDKERRSHIDDFNCDEALGMFAGLNVLPKKSFATDYSYRTQRRHQQQLLRGWISALSPLLFPDANSFSLDFHPIPYRGDEAVLETHYLPKRGKAGPSVLTLFAQEQKRQVLCYANANFTRSTQAGTIWEFVEFWHELSRQISAMAVLRLEVGAVLGVVATDRKEDLLRNDPPARQPLDAAVGGAADQPLAPSRDRHSETSSPGD